MKSIPLLIGISLLALSSVHAKPVHDWKDLEKVHHHVKEAMKEMDRARAANHYDMDGHGAKAEEALHQVDSELQLAIQSAKAAK
jgi:hypothetical protein